VLGSVFLHKVGLVPHATVWNALASIVTAGKCSVIIVHSLNQRMEVILRSLILVVALLGFAAPSSAAECANGVCGLPGQPVRRVVRAVSRPVVRIVKARPVRRVLYRVVHPRRLFAGCRR